MQDWNHGRMHERPVSTRVALCRRPGVGKCKRGTPPPNSCRSRREKPLHMRRLSTIWWIAEWPRWSSTRFKRPCVQTFTSGRPKGREWAQLVVEGPAAGFDRAVHGFTWTIDEETAVWALTVVLPKSPDCDARLIKRKDKSRRCPFDVHIPIMHLAVVVGAQNHDVRG